MIRVRSSWGSAYQERFFVIGYTTTYGMSPTGPAVPRAPARGEIRIRSCAVRPEGGRREPLLETLQRVEVIADAPQQEIGVGAHADERVRMHARRRVRRRRGELVLLRSALA